MLQRPGLGLGRDAGQPHGASAVAIPAAEALDVAGGAVLANFLVKLGRLTDLLKRNFEHLAQILYK